MIMKFPRALVLVQLMVSYSEDVVLEQGKDLVRLRC